MRRSGRGTRTFLLDNNVFIAAIRRPARETATLRLILRIIQDGSIRLVGNEYLLEEMARYAEVFRSGMASTLLHALISKMDVVEVKGKFITICGDYMDLSDPADIIHAATCLQTDATMITNDHHFDGIRDREIIEVWSITEAMHRLL